MLKVGKSAIKKIVIITPILLTIGTFTYAEQYFNPAFILNNKDGKVADLSSFEQGFQPAGVYKVDVFINDSFLSTKEFNFSQSEKANVVSGGLEPCLDSQWLTTIGMKLYELADYEEIKQQSCFDIKKYIPEAEINYNFNIQRLDIQIPQLWMSQQARGYIPPSEWEEGISALALSYNINSNYSDKSDNLFFSLNSGFNAWGFRLRNFSTYSHVDDKESKNKQAKWNNVQTYAEKTIIPLNSELVLGDSFVQNNIFDGISFRGARLYSSEAMLPISLQGYAPIVRGIANSKSTVIIRQNGYIVYQTDVAAGPFEIKDLSAMSISGDLDVTVAETSGDSQRFVVPYSGVPILLREGRTTYDLTAGEFRSGNSNQNNPLFIQATMSRGLAAGYTTYLGTQLAENYQTGLIGFGKNMGRWGAISADMTHANSTLADNKDYKGQSYRFLYSKSMNEMGTTLQLLGYRYSTKGFYTLNDVSYKSMESQLLEEKYDVFGNIYYESNYDNNLNYTKKGRFQLHLNQTLGAIGSLYASTEHQTYWNSESSIRSIQVGLSSSFKGISYNLHWSQQNDLRLDTKKNNNLSLSISLPLSKLFRGGRRLNNEINTHSSYVTNLDGRSSYQTGLNGVLMDDRQLGYSLNLGRSDQSGDFGSLGFNYSGKYGDSGLGYSYSPDAKERNLSLNHSGGMILHSKGLTFGQYLGDTNILVDTNGVKNVKIENSTNIYTDRFGYAILPFAENYRINRIALQADSLDNKTEILNNVQNLVPTKGAILRANFKSRTGHKVLIRLTSTNGGIPYGAKVLEEKLNISSMVASNGQTYLSGLSDQGQILVTWGSEKGESCRADYALDHNQIDSPLARLELNCD